jgi:hypothetical protein
MAAVTDYDLAHEYEAVNYYRRGGAAKIELNRPERLNAWNEQFSLDLLAALNAVGEDPAVRAVLITGAGRAFSSGADLADGGEQSSGQTRLIRPYSSACRAPIRSPSIAISAARVNPTREGTSSDEPPSGTRPMFTNASRKYADSAALTRSQMSASDTPIPAAGPWTALTTGLGIWRMLMMIGW